MVEIIFNRYGQGEFNFDYLLNLTDESFVNVIQERVNADEFLSIKVTESLANVDVTIVNTWGIRKFEYSRVTKKYESTSMTLFDMQWALEVVKNV